MSISSKDTLENQLVESLTVSDLAESMSEIAEFGLDAILEDGIIRDFPIAGSLFGAIKSVNNVRDHLFAKK